MATFSATFLALAFLVTVSKAAPNREINLKLPEECKEKGFCNVKPEGYDEVLDMLDHILTPAFVEAIQKNLEDRAGGATFEYSPQGDWDNCPYKNETEMPVLHAEDSHFDLIIQNSKLLQPIHSITCATENNGHLKDRAQCFRNVGLMSVSRSTESRCETLKANRTFIVYDKTQNDVVTKSYPVNCCCSCKIY